VIAPQTDLPGGQKLSFQLQGDCSKLFSGGGGGEEEGPVLTSRGGKGGKTRFTNLLNEGERGGPSMFQQKKGRNLSGKGEKGKA